jgi:HEAT repeat protein
MRRTMLFDEELLTLSQAAKALPAVGGSRPHTSTLWRWSRKGVKGVRLETRRLGGRIFTSREALERFATALADASPSRRESSTTARPRTPKRRAREVEAANAQLDAAGCGEVR